MIGCANLMRIVGKGPSSHEGSTSHKQGSAFVRTAEAELPCIASLPVIQSATRQLPESRFRAEDFSRATQQ
jgi:hypothetical protein